MIRSVSAALSPRPAWASTGRPLDGPDDPAAAPAALPGALSDAPLDVAPSDTVQLPEEDFVTTLLAGGARSSADAALAHSRRGLPVSARDWGAADVRRYLVAVGLADVAEAFEGEQITGELLLDLSRDEGSLGHAFGEAISERRSSQLAEGALTMGREFALRRAVEALSTTRGRGGGRAAARRDSGSSESSHEGGLPPAVTRAAWRFIAGSPSANQRLRRAGAGAPSASARPRTRKGNLSDAQVKVRKRGAGGFAATFIAIELAIVLTGSDSPWVHLVSMLPGTFMTLAGVTAFFKTWVVTASAGAGRVTRNPETGEDEVAGAWPAQQSMMGGFGRTKKLMASEPDAFLGTETNPNGRIAGNLLLGKFGEEEMLAVPDIDDVALQQRIVRRGKRVMLCMVVFVLALCGVTFWLFGVVVAGTRTNMCGAVGHLSSPDCKRVSWEFVVGSVSIGLVLMFTLSLAVGVFCVMPASATKRRRLRAEQRQREAADAEHAGGDASTTEP